MTARLITPPAALAVTLDQARANLRIDGTSMDALITTFLEGITEALEHELGRALITQCWRVTLDAFPSTSPAAIRLARAPLVSVQSIQYFDLAGVLQTLDPATYIVDTVSAPGRVVPAPGCTWPQAQARVNAVAVNYTCGYGATADSTPKNVRLYVLAKLVEQFEPTTGMERETVQSAFVDRLLDACRTYS